VGLREDKSELLANIGREEINVNILVRPDYLK
jgi:hypothetical protein